MSLLVHGVTVRHSSCVVNRDLQCVDMTVVYCDLLVTSHASGWALNGTQ